MIKGIHHVSMKCNTEEEINKVKDFYISVLGLKIVREWPDGFMIYTGNGYIEIFTNADGEHRLGSIRHFALLTDDVDSLAEKVKDAGYELIEEPNIILKDLDRFMLGIKTVEGTKLEYAIQKAIKLDPDQKYYPFSISTKQNNNLTDNILTQFQEKFTRLNGLMKKFKYDRDDNDNEDINGPNEEIISSFIKEFNNENIIKSVELQENIANSILTSSYYTLRLS